MGISREIKDYTVTVSRIAIAMSKEGRNANEESQIENETEKKDHIPTEDDLTEAARLGDDQRCLELLRFDCKLVETLLPVACRKGIDPCGSKSKGKFYGYTPLIWASRDGKEDLVRELLSKGATVGDRTAGGFTALHKACIGGHSEVFAMEQKMCEH